MNDILQHRTRLYIITLTLLLLVGVMGVAPPNASAHTITPQQCRQYGKVAHFVNGVNQTRATRKCMSKAALHLYIHRCDSASGMSTRVCTGLVHAVLRDPVAPTAWAWNRSLHELLRRESTWNPNALNDSSFACGLFQRLPCPWKYSGAGTTHERVYATAYTQSRNGLRYIEARYGTPEYALAFHDAHNWY